ncbi:MAG: hypothetical protein AUJ92_05060 [Armatimonadetes bacterium CG2_30_59_28]|nr:toxin-antitoxin system HicB family antitoxin [Armatimonadota bacterium]OIO96806.1 MAG: hypothetical protein AUJ92_05060 [Armatimonadetes bacterium CG2_30_59_28]PIU62222.1 MAG: hypothetical protein COS85_19170 [Armatimonadetes bacterium CG07_land_8_20_14_0_80_59_28]PIX42357.1 MAG: hypothetical protein COZ56_09595 [Armatimonadetes bacterium CG_4_8_14_3_um_filter_58_9]PIY42029.1 MAG: hypothetical protein COZ05_14665 [Armatimonadetes bacterium CG_4_10_14_3_um_filter_59_10]PJB62259.1 MAG: hypoth
MPVQSIRVPTELHDKVKHYAKEQGVSMNQYYLYAVATKIASEEALSAFQSRLRRGKPEHLGQVLRRVRSRPPLPGDELE